MKVNFIFEILLQITCLKVPSLLSTHKNVFYMSLRIFEFKIIIFLTICIENN